MAPRFRLRSWRPVGQRLPAKLAAAGFESIDIEATRVYNIGDAGEFLGAAGSDANAVGLDVQDKFISAFVRARKPAKADAC
ncbi:MAG: hypothetical protein WCA38_01335 [Candidatus Acidiferrales bacterium]